MQKSILVLVALLGAVSCQEPCGFRVNITDGETATITSPNYPEQYPNNADCLWSVHATDLSHLSVSCPVVDLQWTIFGCVDTLSFSDAENFNQQPSYCGNKKPPSILGFGDTVFINFLSDNTWTDNGFNCSITARKVDGDPDCECGVAHTAPGRIHNGTTVAKHQYPWLGFLQVKDTSPAEVLCGATIISSHYVLTSALCATGFNSDGIRVRFGEHDLMNNNESPPHKIYDIEQIKVHPDFNRTTLQNDLALIRVGEEILFEPNIYPACLPDGPLELAAGDSVIAAGWGPVSNGASMATLPRQTSLDIDPTDNAACSALLPPRYAVGEGQFCTTTLDGSDVCTGDFGGPVFLSQNDKFVLAGISSFNTECGSGKPTVHSRADFYKSWILAETADSIKCGAV
ncbi:Venom serine protease 34 [Orchesella cincta]|uniref:Venom serine protease 34 n=1 Tax=Orchesella cincta TaxID=48709 RepID=A0A1D2N0C1_ORCCI|nr:Venom serine protease 34 [Orchesella cincta]